MQKFVSCLVMAAIIVSAALMSCDKNDKHPSDDECICIYCDEYGNINNDVSEEILKDLNFMMSPNPTYDMTHLIFKTVGLNSVTITDKEGKVLLEQSFDVQTIAINVRDYSVGEYRVKVDNGKQKSILCLIKIEI